MRLIALLLATIFCLLSFSFAQENLDLQLSETVYFDELFEDIQDAENESESLSFLALDWVLYCIGHENGRRSAEGQNALAFQSNVNLYDDYYLSSPFALPPPLFFSSLS